MLKQILVGAGLCLGAAFFTGASDTALAQDRAKERAQDQSQDSWLETWRQLRSPVAPDTDDIINAARADVVAFLGKAPDFACQYPARAFILAKSKQINFEAMTANCAPFNEFLSKVPFDEIGLVFAAEDISSPPSIMGHIFMSVRGGATDEDAKAFAISYLTNLSQTDPVSASFRLLSSGLDGTLTLGPLNKEVATYVDLSQRAVWEVPIATTRAQRQFMQYYIWELRQNTPPYVFVSFNCATLLHHLLQVAGVQMSHRYGGFITPRELFKAAIRASDEELSLRPSTEWMVHKLAKQANKTADETLEKLRQSGAHAGISNIDLVFAYNVVLSKQARGALSGDDTASALALIDAVTDKRAFDKTDFIGLNFGSPLDSIAPSKISIGHRILEDRDVMTLSYRPASKDLIDPEIEYFTIQESLLAALEVELMPENGELDLSRLALVSMQNLNPISKYLRRKSRAYRFGYFPSVSREMTNFVKTQWGVAVRPVQDVTTYLLSGISADETRPTGLVPSFANTFGIHARLIGNTRLVGEVSQTNLDFGTDYVVRSEYVAVQKAMASGFFVELNAVKETADFDNSKIFEAVTLKFGRFF